MIHARRATGWDATLPTLTFDFGVVPITPGRVVYEQLTVLRLLASFFLLLQMDGHKMEAGIEWLKAL